MSEHVYNQNAATVGRKKCVRECRKEAKSILQKKFETNLTNRYKKKATVHFRVKTDLDAKGLTI